MALLESQYDIICGAALDTDNVPLVCLPIREFYGYLNIAIFDLPYYIRGGEALNADSVPFPPPYSETI